MSEDEEPPQKKQKRFANLNESELDKLLEGAQSKSTKYSTNHAISVYKGKFNNVNNNLIIRLSVEKRVFSYTVFLFNCEVFTKASYGDILLSYS